MRERGTLAASLVVLSALAVGSYWLAEQARRSDPIVRHPGHDADYTAHDLTLTRMDETGRAEYTVSADALVHYADDDSGVLTNPRVVGSKAGRPEMHVRADRGTTTSEGEEVRLYGNVVLDRAAWRGDAPLVVKSEYMRVVPDRETADTDRPVELTMGGSRVDAGSMQFDNAERRVRFDGSGSRVRTVIQPRGAHAARSTAAHGG